MTARRPLRLKWFAIVSLLTLCPLLSGCGTLRLAYAQADTIAGWWLDGYLDFTPAQAPLVRQSLAQWLSWHRARPLGEDVALLDQLARDAAADVTPAQTCRLWAQLQARQMLYLEQLVTGPFGDVLADLGDAQLHHLQARFDESNREWRHKYLRGDADQRQRAAWDRVVDRGALIYGRIDAAQRRFIAERLRASPWDPQRWLTERQRQQRDTIETLQRLPAPGTDRAARLALLRAWATRTVQPADEAARQYREQLVRFQCELAADLHQRTSAEQRRHAAERFQGWAQDLRSAAATPAAATATATATAP